MPEKSNDKIHQKYISHETSRHTREMRRKTKLGCHKTSTGHLRMREHVILSAKFEMGITEIQKVCHFQMNFPDYEFKVYEMDSQNIFELENGITGLTEREIGFLWCIRDRILLL